MKNIIKLAISRLLGLFPTKLPVGVTEFHSWAESIASTYNLPTKDPDSVKFTLASIIMHLGQETAYKSKFFFYLTMTSAASKQVAGSVFYDIKERQKQMLAEAAAKQKEAVSDGQQPKI